MDTPIIDVCPNCQADLQGRKCKRLCTRCGYFESCSDLEPLPLGANPSNPVPRVERARKRSR